MYLINFTKKHKRKATTVLFLEPDEMLTMLAFTPPVHGVSSKNTGAKVKFIFHT